MPPYVSSRAVPFQLSVYVARALVPVPTGPAGPQNSMKTLAPATWRRPRPDSSGRLSGVYSASGGEGVFEAAASALLPTPVGRTADKAGVHATSGTRHLAMR